jgi:imidazolonepropionase-like amidohydrolase
MTPLRLLPLVILACCAIRVDAQDARIKAITGVTLIDGTTRPPVQDAVILIDGARISQVGRRGSVTVPLGATVIEGQGKFVIPGLADMHNHLQSGSMRVQQDLRLNLRRMLVVGVTTIFDPSITLRDFATLKSASSDDASPFARFYSTGPIVSVKGDLFAQMVGGPTPQSAADAQATVKQLAAAGVDAIKAQVDDVSWSMKQGIPMLQLDVLAALVREAHQQKLKVFVHAPMLKPAKDALRAGVDGLMHGIIDAPVDQEFVDLMKRNGASYVPTMGLFHDIGETAAWARRQAPLWDKAGLQPARLYEFFASPAGEKQFQSTFTNLRFTTDHLPIQRANVKTVFDAGLPVVLGTDTGFFGVLLGVATHLELELLVDAGLKPEDALRAATLNAARMIGREKDLGTIEAGKLADLVILDANPLADIRNTTRISRTIKGGVVYEPIDPARPSP